MVTTKQKIEVVGKAPPKQSWWEENKVGIFVLIICSGFIEYYLFMKVFKSKSPNEISQEIIKHPQDFLWVLFFTFVNIGLLIWGITSLI